LYLVSCTLVSNNFMFYLFQFTVTSYFKFQFYKRLKNSHKWETISSENFPIYGYFYLLCKELHLFLEICLPIFPFS